MLVPQALRTSMWLAPSACSTAIWTAGSSSISSPNPDSTHADELFSVMVSFDSSGGQAAH